MDKLNIGFLHPGEMGISLAASAQNTGHVAYWASEGRSQQTKDRAAKFNLIDAQTLEALCEVCSVIISVCPPHAAEDVAGKVMKASFDGFYLDANAISPQRTLKIGRMIEDAGIKFVDGGIIGMPAWESGKTWLYLSGEERGYLATCFDGGPLETEVMGEEIGKASALKMCFAAYTKGTTALLCALLAAAEKLGVREDLEKQWSRDGSDFAEKTKGQVRGVTAKAWRFSGEMQEIAATFGEAGVPKEFHLAASEIYRRISHLKGLSEKPSLKDVLEALIPS
jgi:3-hydroxyisobutyrate dehydrogenase-like beta-hydroxyacid dehydrogenase